MILQNFKLSEERDELIGISGPRLKDFFQKFANTHSPFKMYCLKIVEVTHSQLSRNYLFVIINEYSNYTGEGDEAIEKKFMHYLDDLVRSGYDDNYTKALFFDQDTINKKDGELITAKLKSISKFSQTAMNRYIDLVQAIIMKESPEFIIPEPKDYLPERKGEKNVLLYPEERLKIK